MDYQSALDYLYNKTLVFQHVGVQAYKPGLETTLELAKLFGNPHKSLNTIHIAGTNGKGSTAHLLAAILQSEGYHVGLYTSPHLVDFRERIRVDGKMISEEFVTEFVDTFLNSDYTGRKPSFFELTTIMAFTYFKKSNVDFAVIETGLGGRLDSTNIIEPIASIITNISLDHTALLGDSLAQIAKEKAGIIKPSAPVVIGETTPETEPVFRKRISEVNTSGIFAEQNNEIFDAQRINDRWVIDTYSFGQIVDELSGECQLKNANTVLVAVKVLNELGLCISTRSVTNGFANVCELTGLMGRWMKIDDRPRTFCDTGHNIGGFEYISRQLARESYKTLRIVIGFVSDKDVAHIMPLLPKDAAYYFTQAGVKRAMDATTLLSIARQNGIDGVAFPTVEQAYRQAKADSCSSDFIYIGGSTFVVADLISAIQKK